LSALVVLFLPVYAFWAFLLFAVSLSSKGLRSTLGLYIGAFLLPTFVSLLLLQYLCFGWREEKAEMFFYLRVFPLWLFFVSVVGLAFWFRQRLRQSLRKNYGLFLAAIFFLGTAVIGGETVSLLVTREQCHDLLREAFPSAGILGEWVTCIIWKANYWPADF